MLKHRKVGYGWKGSLAAAVVVFTGSMANAASVTFDYGEVMDGPPLSAVSGTSAVLSTGDTFSGIGHLEAAYASFAWTQGGITVTATAHNGDVAETEIWLYGDSISSGRQAGLGAIQKSEAGFGTTTGAMGSIDVDLTGGTDFKSYQVAVPNSADNATMISMTANETVKLSVDESVTLDLSGLVLRGASHFDLTLAASNVLLSVDNGTFAAFGTFAVDDLLGTMFEFQIDSSNSSGNKEFYVGSVVFDVPSGGTPIVPLPAAAWMGFSMLGGLGAVSKLRNRFASSK